MTAKQTTTLPVSVLETAYAEAQNTLRAFLWATSAADLDAATKKGITDAIEAAEEALRGVACDMSDRTACHRLATETVGTVRFCASCAPNYFQCDDCQLVENVIEQTTVETGRRHAVVCRVCAGE